MYIHYWQRCPETDWSRDRQRQRLAYDVDDVTECRRRNEF